MILKVPLDGCDISSLRYNRQRLMVNLDRPVDEPIAVADRGRRNSPGKGGKDGRTRSPSTGKNRMMGWDIRCYNPGSDKHRHNERKAFVEMMIKANVGKTKAD